MKQRTAMGLGLLCFFLIVPALLLVSTAKEPVYQEKTLSQWLQCIDSRDSPKARAAFQAIRAMGPNAVPFLVHELKVEDSRLKLKLVELSKKQKFIPVNFVDAPTRRERARAALKALGPVAKPAIPALIERFKDGNVGFSFCSPSEPLVAIGRESVPPLLQAAQQTNQWVRFHAVRALRYFDADAPIIVPALINSLKDPEPGVRYGAVGSLMSLRALPEVTIPALTLMLDDATPGVRGIAAEALGSFGGAAKSAAPSLLKHVRDQDKDVRGQSAFSLVKVDLETAKKAPEVKAALTENLQHETWWMPKYCAEALKQIESEAGTGRAE